MSGQALWPRADCPVLRWFLACVAPVPLSALLSGLRVVFVRSLVFVLRCFSSVCVVFCLRVFLSLCLFLELGSQVS